MSRPRAVAANGLRRGFRYYPAEHMARAAQGVVGLKYDPALRSLRGDPRYPLLLRQLDLPA